MIGQNERTILTDDNAYYGLVGLEKFNEIFLQTISHIADLKDLNGAIIPK
jgi:hypothetical protein